MFYYTVLWTSADHPYVVASHIELAWPTVALFYDEYDEVAAGYNEIIAAVAAAEMQPGQAMENMAEDDLRSVTLYAIFHGHLQTLI